MADEADTTGANAQSTSDEAANNTGADATGAGTQTANSTEAAHGKTYTEAEMKAEAAKLSTKSFGRRLREELIKRGIDPDTDKPNASVEELTTRATTAEQRARTLEAKDSVFDFVDDPKNKIGLRPDSRKAFWRQVKDDLEFDDDGKVTNLSQVIRAARSDAPALFIPTTGSVNGGSGSRAVHNNDMNQFIRDRAAGG